MGHIMPYLFMSLCGQTSRVYFWVAILQTRASHRRCVKDKGFIAPYRTYTPRHSPKRVSLSQGSSRCPCQQRPKDTTERTNAHREVTSLTVCVTRLAA